MDGNHDIKSGLWTVIYDYDRPFLSRTFCSPDPFELVIMYNFQDHKFL
jgi:hypothetical protein